MGPLHGCGIARLTAHSNSVSETGRNATTGSRGSGRCIPHLRAGRPRAPRVLSFRPIAALFGGCSNFLGKLKAPPGAYARNLAIDTVEKLKRRYVALQEGNWSPGAHKTAYDMAVLPALVAAENARIPNLNLKLVHNQDLAEWFKGNHLKHARVLVRLPGFTAHRVVADVRRSGGKTSVLVIEPLSLAERPRRTWEEDTLPALGKALKSNDALSVLCLDTQKSENLCHIFALSATSKLTVKGMHL